MERECPKVLPIPSFPLSSCFCTVIVVVMVRCGCSWCGEAIPWHGVMMKRVSWPRSCAGEKVGGLDGCCSPPRWDGHDRVWHSVASSCYCRGGEKDPWKPWPDHELGVTSSQAILRDAASSCSLTGKGRGSCVPVATCYSGGRVKR
jgi:hypothetical protein